MDHNNKGFVECFGLVAEGLEARFRMINSDSCMSVGSSSVCKHCYWLLRCLVMYYYQFDNVWVAWTNADISVVSRFDCKVL